jgi:hypothetical protein
VGLYIYWVSPLQQDRVRSIFIFCICHPLLGVSVCWIGDPPDLKPYLLNPKIKTSPLTANLWTMRPSSLLRQIAAGTAAQRKFPLPNIYPSSSVPRLRPPHADWLPSLINCPTTRPPAWITPEKEIDKKRFTWLIRTIYHLGRSYYLFYKQGLSQVNSNRRIRRDLLNELKKQLKHINVPGSANIVMTRSEFQLCIRTRRDWRKLPRTPPSF